MSFAQLNDSPEVLNALEEKMIEPLCRRLRQTGCSGVFVLLDATVNTRMEGAEHSRAGLYVQKSGADTPTVPLLLYRGSAEVGKAHSVMPHRKWRMEFQTDQFPDYDRWMTPGSAADRAVRAARHLGGGAVVFAAPAGAGRHDVRAVRL